MKNPWMKFFPADWRAEPTLRVCSLAARGLWMEMLALMHEAEPRGHLVINGKPITNNQLSNLVGVPQDTIETLVTELESAGVFSRKKNGAIYSRRIERDENRTRKNRENGKLGGNPSLSKDKEIEQSVIHEDKTHILEARSQKEEEKDSPSLLEPDKPPAEPDEVAEAVTRFNALAKSINGIVAQKINPKRRAALRARLRDCGGLAGWDNALAKARGSPYLRGEMNGFRISLDFITQDSSFTKLMEGFYDDRRQATARAQPQRRNALDEAFSNLGAVIDAREARQRGVETGGDGGTLALQLTAPGAD